MIGMNAETGKVLDGLDHLRQSIKDILTTPIGTRVMRRDYGSRLFDLLDRPMSPELIADIQAAVVMAITKHEPRIQLTKVEVLPVGSEPNYDHNQLANGKLLVNLDGYLTSEGQQVRMENISL